MLSRLILTDFKSFKDASLALGPFTLLVGTNAAGKSNLGDALRFLHAVGLGFTLAETLGGKYGPGGIRQWRGIRGGAKEVCFGAPGTFGLGLSLSDPEGQITSRFALAVDSSNERTGAGMVFEMLSPSNAEGFWANAPNARPELQDFIRRLAPKHIGEERLGVHRLLNSYLFHSAILPLIPHDRALEKLWPAAETMLHALQGMRFLDLDPGAMREPSPPGQTVLGDRGENLSSVLQDICMDPERKLSLLSWVRALTPMDLVDLSFKQDLGGQILVYLVEASGRETSAFSASDGTLRFLALIAALLSPNSGQLYFFEELDNGIHPSRMHLLIELIQQACKQQKVQVIGTTHNPALLTYLDPETLKHAALVYRPDGAADSRIRRITDLPGLHEVIQRRDLGQLHASGWLERTALFSEPDPEGGA